MHKVYEINDIAAFLKKQYCAHCGTVLRRCVKDLRIVKKGDPDHDRYCTVGNGYHPYGDILVRGGAFYCESCGCEVPLMGQVAISEVQSQENCKILTEEALDNIGQKVLQMEQHDTEWIKGKRKKRLFLKIALGCLLLLSLTAELVFILI